MNLFVAGYRRMKICLFNWRNETQIKSLYASFDAHYGRSVRVDTGTKVAADVTIGDYSYINHSSSLENCNIGKFCSISSHVYINPYNHNLSGITTHPQGDYDREQKHVTVGNDVLISLNVTVLNGVTIGDGAVIGAGAVVTHDIGPFEIWGGVPARFIRWRITDKTVRERLVELKWWDMDDMHRKLLIDKYNDSLDGILDENFDDH